MSQSYGLKPGLSARVQYLVDEAATASQIGSGDVPVLATPAMIAVLEEAAVKALTDRLEEGKTTVGSRVEVRHLSPTAVGREITAEAHLESVDGCRLTFRVEAFDPSGRIGEGVHERVIVDRQKFLSAAASRE